MPDQNSEAIRQYLVSLIGDSRNIRRKVTTLRTATVQRQRTLAADIAELAEFIDCSARALFDALPAYLQPSAADNTEASQTRTRPRRNSIPREVRWPALAIERVLELADEYHSKHGKWPTGSSGRIADSSPDTWTGIDIALRHGNRGLPGGTSLAKLLAERRGRRSRSLVKHYSIDKILEWADDHRARTGSWPKVYSGEVTAEPMVTWNMVGHALSRGGHGLPGGVSLARLLTEHRGVPNRLDKRPLGESLILKWADAHKKRTGSWPTKDSGEIPRSNGETWQRIDNALRQGNRTLAGNSSLAQLLAAMRGVPNRKALPHFDPETILRWADDHHAHFDRWPTTWSGSVVAAPHETWAAVDAAFKAGGRGLAGCGYRSLSHMLDERRGRLVRRGGRPAIRVMPEPATPAAAGKGRGKRKK